MNSHEHRRFFTNMRISIISLSVLFLIGKCEAAKDSFEWTPELENALVKIYHQTHLSKSKHKNRLKEAWDEKFPMYTDLQDNYLRQHAEVVIRRTGGAVGGIRKNEYFKYTPQLKSDLLEMYEKTKPGGKGHSTRLYEEWIQKHRNLSYVNQQNLFKEGKYLYEKSKQDVGARSTRIKYVWTKDVADELAQLYNRNDDPKQWKGIHEEWVTKHPDFRDITPEYLKWKAGFFFRERKEPSEIQEQSKKRIRWTRQLNADLLHINEQTGPGTNRQNIVIHEYWRKIHPELPDPGVKRLKFQKQNLMYKGYVPKESEKRRARINFNWVLPSVQERGSTESPNDEETKVE